MLTKNTTLWNRDTPKTSRMADKHQQFIQACAAGDTDLVKQLQPDVPLQTAEFLLNAFAVAIEQKRTSIIEFLLQECPEEFNSRFPDAPLLQAMEAGPEVYALFIRKDPSIARRSFGHMGDALGLAVMRNDARLMRRCFQAKSKQGVGIMEEFQSPAAGFCQIAIDFRSKIQQCYYDCSKLLYFGSISIILLIYSFINLGLPFTLLLLCFIILISSHIFLICSLTFPLTLTLTLTLTLFVICFIILLSSLVFFISSLTLPFALFVFCFVIFFSSLVFLIHSCILLILPPCDERRLYFWELGISVPKHHFVYKWIVDPTWFGIGHDVTAVDFDISVWEPWPTFNVLKFHYRWNGSDRSD
ncbi:hypothetical protein ONZ43_g6495 [Nemania bipapillata]|uniref:Uncharacterized protein n=1 Tax=Nemania bipapillata TaxID=110536 RepID=A0ACC2HYP9_9PEZI|nr:hypothetical protein ONZ43_g6495 [Nemania bipapillata]